MNHFCEILEQTMKHSFTKRANVRLINIKSDSDRVWYLNTYMMKKYNHAMWKLMEIKHTHREYVVFNFL